MKKIYSILFFTLFALSGFVMKAQTVAPVICMVTVDDSSKHNIVYYDKTQYTSADSFILWRETITPGVFMRLMAQNNTVISFFMDMDTAGNPNIKLHRYKLQIWDPVNGYSQLGPYHTVLFCLQNVANYNWNQYDVEGTGTGLVNEYVVMQDDNSTGAWHPIDSVSGTGNSWIDPNVALYPNGQWRLATLWNITCTPTARQGNNEVESAIAKSKSNITNNRSAGINQLKAASINLFPNPASDQITLRLNFPTSQNTFIKLYNVLGAEVSSTVLPAGKDELQIPVSGLDKGIYFAEISNSQTKITKRVAVQ